MPTFSGSITTTGKSEAIRLDKALFRLHPEFRQKAKVRAQVISPGHALISVIDGEAAPVPEEDPVVGAFLGFLEKDLKTRPARRSRLSKASLARAIHLTRHAKVSDDDTLPRNVTI
jgi:antitoxin PrlF